MSTTRTPRLPGRDRARTSFRVVGLVLLLMALALIGVGLRDFFSSLSSDTHEAADQIWTAFVGLLLLGPAGWCLQVGFMSSPAAPEGAECFQCGTANDEGAQLCASCGTALVG